ncbi:MAG: ATP-binding protein [Patescibacteria group bacterium]
MKIDEKISLIKSIRNIVYIRWLFFVGLFVLGAVVQINKKAFLNLEGDIFLLFVVGYFIFNALSHLCVLGGEKCDDKVLLTAKASQFFIDPIFFTFLIYFSGGSESNIYILYFIPLAIASVLYRPIIIFLELFYSTVLYLAIILAEHFNYFNLGKNDLLGSFYFQDNLYEKILNISSTIFILWTVGILNIFLVSLLRRSRQQLMDEKNKVRLSTEALTDGIIMFDQGFRITLVNKRAEMIFNIRREDYEGKNILSTRLKAPLKDFFRLTKEVASNGKNVFSKEFSFKVKGVSIIIQSSVVLMLDKKGNQMGAIQSFHDITREKALATMKNEFISIAAHQLRTPISVIKWVLSMALKGDFGHLTKDLEKYLERANITNEQMIALVNDLLNISRIEEGRFGYEFKFEDIEKIIIQVIKEFKDSDLLREKKLKIKFLKPKEKLPKVKIDKNKFVMVLQNIVSNAIKYSKEKTEIIFKVELGKKFMKMYIVDRGIGIPAEEHDKVFSRFFRATNAKKKGIKGSGLGLFLARNIINSHGGDIWFESKEEKGTSFIFTLPLAKYFTPKKADDEFGNFLKSF